MCDVCPLVPDVVGIISSVAGGAAFLLILVWIIMRQPPRCLRPLSHVMNRIWVKAGSHALIPKLKILIAVYQVIVSIPDVYDVIVPPEYYDWMWVFSIFTFAWDDLVIPGACLPGGFVNRVWLRGVVPLAGMLAIIPLNLVRTIIVHLTTRAPGLPPLFKGFLDSLPILLFIAFCFCASVSSGLFAAWSYVEFEVETPVGSGTPIKAKFLRGDLSVACSGSVFSPSIDTTNAEYEEIEWYSLLFIAIWPLGVPLLYILVLLPNRYAILQRRSTRLVRATEFLHREYEPHYFFWEPVVLFERLVIVGFLQWIPPTHYFLRLQTGQIVTLIYTVALMFIQPFKRYDMDVLAIAAQLSVLAFFYGAINIKLHHELTEVDTVEMGLARKITGFRSSFTMALIIFICNLTTIVVFLTMTLYQLRTQRETRIVRLVHNNQVPELTLSEQMRYHLFLSHIWSSGQDQVATIKRQLQLLLPGARIFLDVDDLQEIAKLEEYVEQSQCILIFLSRGYFFSTNCLREIDHALQLNKPLVLVHETDLSHGGAELETLISDCKSKDRMGVFERQTTILQWHRQYDFQLETLKEIAAALLQAGMRRATKPPELYIPNEITSQRMVWEHKTQCYVSPCNIGAAAVAQELKDRYKTSRLRFTSIDAKHKFSEEAVTHKDRIELPSKEISKRRQLLKRSNSSGENRSPSRRSPTSGSFRNISRLLSANVDITHVRHARVTYKPKPAPTPRPC